MMIASDSETLRLTRALLALDTTDPAGRELPAAKLVAGTLAEAGIDSELVMLAPGRASLVARLRGAGTKRGLAFSAHLDTINVAQPGWRHGPFAGTIEEGRLYGRGAADMKGGVAAMAMAAIEIKRSGRQLTGDLVLAFSAAENARCAGAKQLVNEGHLDGIGALVVSEPSALRLFIAEKGKITIRATARGEHGHNAFADQRTGDRGNAIIRLARFLDRAHDLRLSAPPHRLLSPPTINVGTIGGGSSAVLIPDEASAEIDVRMLPGMEPNEVMAAFSALASPHVTLTLMEAVPPVETTEDHEFVKLCAGVCAAETGTPCRPEGVGYMSDGAVIVPALGMPMVIIGPGEVGMSGAVDESVSLAALESSRRIFQAIAEQYLT